VSKRALFERLELTDEDHQHLVKYRGGCSCHISPPCSNCCNHITFDEADELGLLDEKPGKTELLEEMLLMQDQFNVISSGLDWREKKLAWNRAIWIECAVIVNHQGWKWLNKQDAHTPLVKMELVDIWQFLMSWMLDNNMTPKECEAFVFFEMGHNSNPVLLDSIEDIARNASGYDLEFTTAHFMAALDVAGMSFEDLYAKYAGKFTLNAFRHENGYKDGTYRKTWHDGRKDVEHLTEILEGMDASHVDFLADVYAALGERYEHR
jgi:hypothetical protein